VQANPLRNSGTGIAADDDRLDFGHFAFQILGILQVKLFADHDPQNRVAEKLHPFIGGQPVANARGMFQRIGQKLHVLEPIAQFLLARLEVGLDRAGRVFSQVVVHSSGESCEENA